MEFVFDGCRAILTLIILSHELSLQWQYKGCVVPLVLTMPSSSPCAGPSQSYHAYTCGFKEDDLNIIPTTKQLGTSNF
eukprot:1633560-Amphidinium_carterae.1